MFKHSVEVEGAARLVLTVTFTVEGIIAAHVVSLATVQNDHTGTVGFPWTAVASIAQARVAIFLKHRIYGVMLVKGINHTVAGQFSLWRLWPWLLLCL